ncbi:hypothetical protein FB567DRAFT_618510 [Paraphoma chrysanthemicola]|uniref:VOC domain-containing protein n=1 Tax=Paraphoma chrysanthemicola TaxID=798071 RepID=A0A8K0RAX6_9PLEO|nr:hypothetical protein FB567DRAFT_618510 [Paraphoma chrysanthemicola]
MSPVTQFSSIASFSKPPRLPVIHEHRRSVKWYYDVFGFKKLRNSTLNDRALTPDAPIFSTYGPTLQKVKTAYLSAGNGVGVEVFEFMDPPYQAPEGFDYVRGGIGHIGITTPHVDEVVQKILDNGGRQIGEQLDLGVAREGVQRTAAYLQDPWGTVLELLMGDWVAQLANSG